MTIDKTMFDKYDGGCRAVEAVAIIVEWQHKGLYDQVDAIELALEFGGPGEWDEARIQRLCEGIGLKADQVAERRRKAAEMQAEFQARRLAHV
jgi:hypothetical protein